MTRLAAGALNTALNQACLTVTTAREGPRQTALIGSDFAVITDQREGDLRSSIHRKTALDITELPKYFS